MRDQRSQQRQRRAGGAVRSVADRSAVEENRALAPQTAQAPHGWPPVDREPPCVGRDSPDSAERGSLAGYAGEVSGSFDLLAAATGLGRAGRLAENLARVPERAEPAPAAGMERIVSGRQFRPGEKRGAEVGKTRRGKGTKWMVVVDGRGIPLGDHLCSAFPSEVRLAETTLAAIRVGRRHRAGRPRQTSFVSTIDLCSDGDCEGFPAMRAFRTNGFVLVLAVLAKLGRVLPCSAHPHHPTAPCTLLLEELGFVFGLALLAKSRNLPAF